jgi:hypothetical protein
MNIATETIPQLIPIGGTKDKHGESGTNYYLLPRYDDEGNDVFPTRKAVDAHLEANALPTHRHCGHEHDCCGCVFTYLPNVIAFDKISDQWIISQSWGRNV